jgi:hypothetical protein
MKALRHGGKVMANAANESVFGVAQGTISCPIFSN